MEFLYCDVNMRKAECYSYSEKHEISDGNIINTEMVTYFNPNIWQNNTNREAQLFGMVWHFVKYTHSLSEFDEKVDTALI